MSCYAPLQPQKPSTDNPPASTPALDDATVPLAPPLPPAVADVAALGCVSPPVVGAVTTRGATGAGTIRGSE